MKCLRMLLRPLALMCLLALPATAADITLMDRNPVLSHDYLSGWRFDEGIFGRDVLHYLGCETLACAATKSQADLAKAKPQAGLRDGMFQNLGGAVSIGEIFDSLANTALMLSQVIKISGPIVPGDVDRLKEFVEDNGLMNCSEPGFCPYNTVIALDSPGGHLQAALEIAHYVQQNNFVTLLQKDAVCASACSMIFLSGYTTYEGVFFPRRFAHDTARLGLHKPSLYVPPRSYSADQMNEMQDIINTTLNDVVEVFVGAKVEIDILQEMYKTKPKEMYYLTTPEMESIGRVFHSPGAGRFAPTRAQALTLCAEDYKARYGRYEPQLLRTMASGQDVFITYVPRSDYACYGARQEGQWVYEICTPSGSRPDQFDRLACQLFRCAADMDGTMENCGSAADVHNNDNLGDALKDLRNSQLLRLVNDTLRSPYRSNSIACTRTGECAYKPLKPVPAWVTKAPVPQTYCGQVDMRSPVNLKRLQHALNANGMNVGTPDGSIGPKTLGAIGTANKRFLGTDSQWAQPELLLALGIPQDEVNNALICN
ncbi:hypothetical protein [Parasedimentitalea marina]|nr:hypothetical protein [Parasedimentitalea marina]